MLFWQPSLSRGTLIFFIIIFSARLISFVCFSSVGGYTKAMGSMFQQELYHEKMSGFMEILGDRMQVRGFLGWDLYALFVGVSVSP